MPAKRQREEDEGEETEDGEEMSTQSMAITDSDPNMEDLSPVGNPDVYTRLMKSFGELDIIPFTYEKEITYKDEESVVSDALQWICEQTQDESNTSAKLLYVLRHLIPQKNIFDFIRQQGDFTIDEVSHRISNKDGLAMDYDENDPFVGIEILCNHEKDAMLNAFPTKSTSFINMHQFLEHTVCQFLFAEPQVGMEYPGAIKLFIPVEFTDVNDPILIALHAVKNFNISTENFYKMFKIYSDDEKSDWIKKNIHILLGQNKTLWVSAKLKHNSKKNVIGLFATILPNSRNAAIFLKQCPTALYIAKNYYSNNERLNVSEYIIPTRSFSPMFKQFSQSAENNMIVKMKEVLKKDLVLTFFDYIQLKIEPRVIQLVSEKFEPKLFVGVTDNIPHVCMLLTEDTDASRCQLTKEICGHFISEKKISLFVVVPNQLNIWASYFEHEYKNDEICVYRSATDGVPSNATLILIDFNRIGTFYEKICADLEIENLIIENFMKCTGKQYCQTLFSQLVYKNMILITGDSKMPGRVLNLLPMTKLSGLFNGVPFHPLVNFVKDHSIWCPSKPDMEEFTPQLVSAKKSRGVSSRGMSSRGRKVTSIMSRGVTNSRRSVSFSPNVIVPTAVITKKKMISPIDEILIHKNPKQFSNAKTYYMETPEELLNFSKAIFGVSTDVKNKYLAIWMEMHAGGHFNAFNALYDLLFGLKKAKKFIVDENFEQEEVKNGFCGLCLNNNASTKYYSVIKCKHLFCEQCLVSWVNNCGNDCPCAITTTNEKMQVTKAKIFPGDGAHLSNSSKFFSSNSDDVTLNQKSTFLLETLLPKHGRMIILTQYERIVTTYKSLFQSHDFFICDDFDQFKTHCSERVLLIKTYDNIKDDDIKSLCESHIVLNDISKRVQHHIVALNNNAMKDHLHFLLYEHGIDRLQFFEFSRELSLLEKQMIVFEEETNQIMNIILSAEDTQCLLKTLQADDGTHLWEDALQSLYSTEVVNGIIQIEYNNGHCWKIIPDIREVKFNDLFFPFSAIFENPQIIAKAVMTQQRFCDKAEIWRMVHFANENRPGYISLSFPFLFLIDMIFFL